jgi:hypothetical protein
MEVLLLRSDDEEINFDVAGIRVHRYQRGDLIRSREVISRLLLDGLRQIDQTKNLQVQRAVHALDSDAMEFITAWASEPGFHGPVSTTMADALVSINRTAALARLQSLGIVRCEPLHPSGKPAFLWTPFGHEVLVHLGVRASAVSLEVQRMQDLNPPSA